MTTDEFWELIDRARAQAGEHDANEVAERFTRIVAALPRDEILAAQRILDSVLAQASLVDLWAAAYVINGGCSDDGFDDFRGWLLAQGREVFERAVADPDTLADLPLVPDVVRIGEDLWGESMVFAVWAAWEQVTGEACPPGDPDDIEPPSPLVLAYDFDDNDAVAARLPRLVALISSAGDE